jgi:membrane-bound lytic murein transglycosylase F
MHHGAASYFLYRGEQMGFEYELVQAFAKELGVELEVLTPPSGIELTEWLKAGKGDVIAGLGTMNEDDAAPLRASIPYLETTAQIVIKSAGSDTRDGFTLAGKTIAIQPDAFYAQQLLAPALASPLPPVLVHIQSDNGVGEALRVMDQGQAAAMLVITPLAEFVHRLQPGKLRTVWTSPEPVRLVWVVRPEQTDLLRAINVYLEKVNRSGLRKILFEKYFVTPEHLRNITHVRESTLIAKRLSRFDHLIARHAEEAGFDWRLVAALIFEESRFDHKRISEAGAYGLMQITPRAARDMGVKNYMAPRGNIEAGVKYLRTLARQFPYGRSDDRLALVLASYFIGPGHVEDAQRLARVLGYDPHCWAESMERVLPLLEDSAYHRQTLYGFAPGGRAVRYVNAIRKRYSLYSHYVARELAPLDSRASSQAASAAG